MLSWRELASMDRDLVTIGSHTVTHPILTGISREELLHELAESRSWLERKLCRPVEHFCYPNGVFNDQVVACVRRYYRSAVNSLPGRVSPGDGLHGLKRISTARGLPLLAWRLHRLAA